MTKNIKSTKERREEQRQKEREGSIHSRRECEWAQGLLKSAGSGILEDFIEYTESYVQADKSFKNVLDQRLGHILNHETTHSNIMDPRWCQTVRGAVHEEWLNRGGEREVEQLMENEDWRLSMGEYDQWMDDCIREHRLETFKWLINAPVARAILDQKQDKHTWNETILNDLVRAGNTRAFNYFCWQWNHGDHPAPKNDVNWIRCLRVACEAQSKNSIMMLWESKERWSTINDGCIVLDLLKSAYPRMADVLEVCQSQHHLKQACKSDQDLTVGLKTSSVVKRI